ncbi:NAD(P)H-dependent oxidoreductase [Loktanella sp. D2R18]|uniref:NADPH-dependent FMN reductase n=1 Tax=Rhodobacterales TaxID=204455 RepID=UPI000DE8CBA5|nr:MULTISPECIES: NADPH-dependent FMN reductase [Rhodobacterales]MDO6591252.1 NADPH-dependent FMN reductase [Yoonia sp. 1_MG-2023]RBW46207.1 NAD(P)H-dependent oxidoreductase [Loktanella sp. D2R18]
MNILAISGSTRVESTNTALLRGLSRIAPASTTVNVYDQLATLPVFSTDLDAQPPLAITNFKRLAVDADGIIFASPEYVRSLPGGLKNAIDWLVSGDAIIAKPMAILHASHRGDDMLDALRIVLATVSSGFSTDIFARFSLIGKTPTQVADIMSDPQNAAHLATFLNEFTALAKPRAPS